MRFRTVTSIAATVGVLYACGETLAEPGDDTNADGGTDGVAGSDGPPASTDSMIPTGDLCDRGKSFGAPTVVPVNGDYSIEAARFDDGRTGAYMALCPADGNKVGCDLFQSPYQNGIFATHNPLGGVSSPFYDSYPTVTANGQLLVFGSTRDGGVKIFVAQSINATFANSTAREQKFEPSLVNTNEPYVLGSGAALWFGGTNTSSNWEIYRTTGWGTDAAAPIARVEELSSSSDDQAPVVAEDEREVFFSSNRPPSLGGLDIHRATKAPGDTTFSNIVRLDALSTNGNDWPVWISPDRCDLYFINKNPGTNVATLRVASRR